MKQKNMKLLAMAEAVRKGAVTELCLYEGIKLVADSTSDKDLACTLLAYGLQFPSLP